jgi:hypothetical protein
MKVSSDLCLGSVTVRKQFLLVVEQLFTRFGRKLLILG